MHEIDSNLSKKDVHLIVVSLIREFLVAAIPDIQQ
jgi:hypothetical protein